MRNSNEPYYNYAGAFKCLQDDAGDVAFLKQSILMALSAAEQLKYKILCLNDQSAGKISKILTKPRANLIWLPLKHGME